MLLLFKYPHPQDKDPTCLKGAGYLGWTQRYSLLLICILHGIYLGIFRVIFNGIFHIPKNKNIVFFIYIHNIYIYIYIYNKYILYIYNIIYIIYIFIGYIRFLRAISNIIAPRTRIFCSRPNEWKYVWK